MKLFYALKKELDVDITYLCCKSGEPLNGKNDISQSSGLKYNEICH